MTILVTGGTGFLGLHLVSQLCEAGHDVRVLTRDPSGHALRHFPSVRVQAHHGDIRDPQAVMDAAAGCESIIHAAGLFRFWGEARDFETTNVNGTANVLAAARAHTIERLVYISSAAVIGQPDPGAVIDETHAPHPADAYQASKLAAETLIGEAVAREGLNAVILRPGAFYGPGGTYAFNRLFVRDPLRGIIMQINGGRFITFPAYVGDVAQAAILALTRGEAGAIYHICGDPLTHKAAFDIVCAEARLPIPRLNIPEWLGILTARVLTWLSRLTGREPFYPLTLRSYVYNDWNVSSDKARRELGFVPTDFRIGIRRTVAWYRAGQPERFHEVDCHLS